MRFKYKISPDGRQILTVPEGQPLKKASLDLTSSWPTAPGGDAQFPGFTGFATGATATRGYSQGLAPGTETGGILDLPGIASNTGTFGGNTLQGSQYTGGIGGDVVMPEIADAIAPYIRQKSYMRSFCPTITMRGYQLNIPKFTQGAIAYYVKEGVTSPTTAVGTGVVVLQAKKMMANMTITNELQEDNIIPILPALKEEFARAFALAEEQAFILGELSPTFHDNTALAYGAAASGNNKQMFDGLTKVSINNGDYTSNTNSGDGYGAPSVNLNGNPLSPQNLVTGMRYLNLFGRDRTDLLAIVSLTEQESLLTDPTVLTALDRFGPQTQYLTGEIGRAFGVGIVATNLLEVTEHSFVDSSAATNYLLGWDLAGSIVGRKAGVVQGTAAAATICGRRKFTATSGNMTDKREAFLMNRSAILIGDRRQFKLAASDMLFMMSDQLLLCASERIGFCSPYPRGLCKFVAIGDPS